MAPSIAKADVVLFRPDGTTTTVAEITSRLAMRRQIHRETHGSACMTRTSTVLLRPTEEQDAQLRSLADASSELWNMANYERRQAFFAHTKMPTFGSQCHEFKDSEPFRKLGVHKSQALLGKLNAAWSSFWALKRLQKQGKLPSNIRKVSPPRYWKKGGKRILKAICVRNDGWRLGDEAISMKRGPKIPYASGQMWVGKQGQLEITIDERTGKWYAHIPSEVEMPPPLHPTRSKRAKLDLGIVNLSALTIEGKRPVVYSGRAVLSDWVYRTKKIAERQSLLPRHRHTSEWIGAAYRRKGLRKKHAIYAMCRDIFERLDEEGVGELVVGHPYGVRDESIGRHNNQKRDLFWAYRQTLGRLHELGEEYGIKVTEPPEEDGGERGTSSTCYFCKVKHPKAKHSGRVHRGLYVCPVKHMAINADVNGSANMDMNLAVDRPPEMADSGSGLLAQPMLLRWNYNAWK
jgi:putative transposase